MKAVYFVGIVALCASLCSCERLTSKKMRTPVLEEIEESISDPKNAVRPNSEGRPPEMVLAGRDFPAHLEVMAFDDPSEFVIEHSGEWDVLSECSSSDHVFGKGALSFTIDKKTKAKKYLISIKPTGKIILPSNCNAIRLWMRIRSRDKYTGGGTFGYADAILRDSENNKFKI